MVKSCDHVRIHHMKYLTTIHISVGDSTVEELIDILYKDDRVIKGLCMNSQFRTRRWKILDIRDRDNTMGEFDLTYGDTHAAAKIASYVKEKLSEDIIKEEIILCTGPNNTIFLCDEDFECLRFSQNKRLEIINKEMDLYCYQ